MIGPMPAPDVYVDPSDAVGTLRVLNQKANTLRTPLTQIKNLMVADHVKNLESRGSLYGGWPPASSQTKIGTELMNKTGALKKSLAAKGRKGSGGATGVKGTTAWAGTGIFYARFHQAGARAGSRRGTLPKRELIGITDSTTAQATEIIAQYLKPR